jgi:hypothetical protein
MLIPNLEKLISVPGKLFSGSEKLISNSEKIFSVLGKLFSGLEKLISNLEKTIPGAGKLFPRVGGVGGAANAPLEGGIHPPRENTLR